MYEYDTSLVLFPINLLQRFLGYDNKVNFLEVELENFKRYDFISNEIKMKLTNQLKVVDWRQLNPSLFNAIEVEKNVMFLILLLIIIVAAFNLISSMFILVSNKKRYWCFESSRCIKVKFIENIYYKRVYNRFLWHSIRLNSWFSFLL